MAWSSPARLTLVFAIITSSARVAGCQELRALEAGFQQQRLSSTADNQPSALSSSIKTVGWATYGSLLAGSAGLVVDDIYCKQHHGNEQGFIFGPCTFYAGGGFATGWFGGATVGAALGAARAAQKRGCPRRAALMRAFAGAALGTAPGLSIVAPRPGKYPPSRSVVILGTPLLAGVGAVLATIGCHAP